VSGVDRLRLDPRTRAYFDDELRVLRELLWEFAEEHPKVGTRLGVNRDGSADPYVNQLLDGTAFLAARIQRKLDDEFPVFTRHLLERVAPELLAPIPAMTVVGFEPHPKAPGLENGVTVARGTALNTAPPAVSDTPCTFTTAQDVVLWPLRVADLALLPATRLDHAGLERPPKAQAALKLTLSTYQGMPAGALALDRLRLYFPPAAGVGFTLFDLVVADGLGVAVRAPEGDAGTRLPIEALSLPAFAREHTLLPPNRAGFHGHQLLLEGLGLPARFLFCDIAGLAPALAGVEGDRFEVYLFLSRYDTSLEGRLGAENVALFATPAANLFARASAPITLDHRRRRHRLVVDRSRDLDFEIFAIRRLDAHGRDREARLRPLYETDPASGAEAFYTAERLPRRFPPAPAGGVGETRGSVYRGGDLHVTLTGRDSAWTSAHFESLTAKLWCTNRDLVRFVDFEVGREHFRAGAAGPAVRGVRCLVQPTPPREPLAAGRENWMLINHLAPTYAGLLGPDGGGGTGDPRALVDLLATYAPSPRQRRPLDAIRSLRVDHVVRRLPECRPPSFARGLAVRLEIDPGELEGMSPVVLGTLIERALAIFVTINGFVETAIATTERGEIKRWPPRPGDRAML
jgi:type VI secretion system protein ImpG